MTELCVGLDYRPALVNREGIGRYTRELVRAFVEQGADEGLRLFSSTFSAPRFSRAELGIEHSRLRSVRWRIPSKLLPHLMRFSGRGADDWLGGVDVFHHTQPNLLRVRRAVEVSTIFDCIYMLGQGWLDEASAERMERAAREQVRRSKLVLVPTKFVAEEVIQRLGAKREQVVVTELGCDHARHSALPAAAAAKNAERFVLSVSRVDARKNHVRMLAAFEKLCSGGFPQRWIIAGPRGHGAEAFEAALERSSVRARVEWRHYVSDEELGRLYAKADVLLFASLSEGFGLPPLEAMLHSLPVVVGDVACLAEVCGDGAQYVDPADVESIANGMRRVLADAEFARELGLRGLARARQFTWKECARKTLAAYELARR